MCPLEPFVDHKESVCIQAIIIADTKVQRTQAKVLMYAKHPFLRDLFIPK